MASNPEMTLTPAESRNLQCLAGVMIPASTEFNVPSAGDPIIFADMTKTMGRDLPDVRKALGALAELSSKPFADLPEPDRETIMASFLAGGGAALATLKRVILQCYYRDDRVVISLGLEPRPPFPKGHVLEQGDWSLLDPVKARPKMWRDVPPR
jgi:hypothetical protein